uniref:Spore protein YkvP/CgeB glycosyl transferase-like domain-containing protein n=1 Tax=Palpitomonas bilix TaxID=652834 RepID=A0A7S3DCI6_9EUKA|mmetsp:Transcript_30849/g.80862  ORF Transcript_30849/g.80862 Transcript_30849/m.80862 type:complete len:1239 (+) Transcript_30849:348-4064(+)
MMSTSAIRPRRGNLKNKWTLIFVAAVSIILSSAFLLHSRLNTPGKAECEKYFRQSSNAVEVSGKNEVKKVQPAPPPPPLPAVQKRRRMRIAIICDEFSLSHISPSSSEIDMIQLLPDRYEAQLNAHQPEVLFLESIWKGARGQWQGSIYVNTVRNSYMFQVIQWFKSRQRKVIFWSKEDPPHYEQYLQFAQASDHVFTTSLETLAAYERDVPPTTTVELFPFAIEPTLHNPFWGMSEKPKKDDCCFAGSWMGYKYPKRAEAIRMLFDAALEVGNLTVYDRISGISDEKHRFPSKYSPFIQPAVPYEEVLEFFKGCKVVLNVNSVQNSASMMSRRMLELPALGIPLVTNPSNAIDFFLPIEGVEVVGTMERAREVLHSAILGEVEEGVDKVGALVRRTLSIDHTYHRRFNEIISSFGGGVPLREQFAVVFTAVDSCLPSPSRSHVGGGGGGEKGREGEMMLSPQLSRVLANYYRQQYSFKALVLLVEDEEKAGVCRSALDGMSVHVAVMPDQSEWEEVHQPEFAARRGGKDVGGGVGDDTSLPGQVEMLSRVIFNSIPHLSVYKYYLVHFSPSSFYGRLYLRDVMSAAAAKSASLFFKHLRFSAIRAEGGGGEGIEVKKIGKKYLHCDQLSLFPSLSFPTLTISMEEVSSTGIGYACATDQYDYIENIYTITSSPSLPPSSAWSSSLTRAKAVVSSNGRVGKKRSVLVVVSYPNTMRDSSLRDTLVHTIAAAVADLDKTMNAELLLLSPLRRLLPGGSWVDDVSPFVDFCSHAEEGMGKLQKVLGHGWKIIDMYASFLCTSHTNATKEEDVAEWDVLTGSPLLKRLLARSSVRTSIRAGIQLSRTALMQVGEEIARSTAYDSVVLPSSLYYSSCLSRATSFPPSVSHLDGVDTFLHPLSSASHLRMVVYADVNDMGMAFTAGLSSGGSGGGRSRAVRGTNDEGEVEVFRLLPTPHTLSLVFTRFDPLGWKGWSPIMLSPSSPLRSGDGGDDSEREGEKEKDKGGKEYTICMWTHPERYLQDDTYLPTLIETANRTYARGVRFSVRDVGILSFLEGDMLRGGTIPAHTSAVEGEVAELLFSPWGTHPSVSDQVERQVRKAKERKMGKNQMKVPLIESVPFPFSKCGVVAFSSIPDHISSTDPSMLEMDRVFRLAQAHSYPIAVEDYCEVQQQQFQKMEEKQTGCVFPFSSRVHRYRTVGGLSSWAKKTLSGSDGGGDEQKEREGMYGDVTDLHSHLLAAV